MHFLNIDAHPEKSDASTENLLIGYYSNYVLKHLHSSFNSPLTMPPMFAGLMEVNLFSRNKF